MIWGECIGQPIKLKLKPHATPVWNKPYPTPLKHRAALERELQCQCTLAQRDTQTKRGQMSWLVLPRLWSSQKEWTN
jgi:hypothetical protein